MNLATLTNIGRAAFVRAVAALPLHFAWGSGLVAWDNDPDQPHLNESLVEAASLTNELGRRQVNRVGFAAPDPDGEIVIPIGRLTDGEVEVGRYSLSEKATPTLYVRVDFEFADAGNQIIREVGLFVNTVVKAELPPGQRYFLPAELEDQGELLAIQRLDPSILRSPAVRQSFDFILPI